MRPTKRKTRRMQAQKRTSALESLLIVPDCHIPFHDKRAWALMLQVAQDLKPYYLYTIGDFMDFYAVSDHSKDPNRALKLDEELKAGEAALDQLDALGATHKIFHNGNHCDRMERYLRNKAPELFNLISVPDLLHLEERGWQHVPYKQYSKLGKLHFTHDVGTAGRYAAYKALDAFQHSVITGHTHRLSYIVEGNATGEEFKLSAQFGWLGDAKEIDYMNRAKVNKDWALGFGYGYHNPSTGYVYVVPVPLIDYTCVVNAKLYTG